MKTPRADVSTEATEVTSVVDAHTSEAYTKRVYKCAYCPMVSKWNKRDIVLHILHIHMLKKVYSCYYCNFGSSKSSQLLHQHNKQYHADKPSLVRDEFKLLKNIVPIRGEGGLTPIAYVSDEVGAVLSLKELSLLLKISVRKTKYDVLVNFEEQQGLQDEPHTHESGVSCDAEDSHSF